jgi:hypothetical protein
MEWIYVVVFVSLFEKAAIQIHVSRLSISDFYFFVVVETKKKEKLTSIKRC